MYPIYYSEQSPRKEQLHQKLYVVYVSQRKGGGKKWITKKRAIGIIIAAMGARPYAFTIAMGLPAHTETAFVDAMVEGIADCASAYDTAVVGGDITRSKELILTGTCFGFADKPVRRAGAKVGSMRDRFGWQRCAWLKNNKRRVDCAEKSGGNSEKNTVPAGTDNTGRY